MTEKIAALFPGQGSQFVGMGKDLYENFHVAREVFEEASDSCHLNIKRLCFDGPESDLTLTENTQPCLVTTSIAAFRVAQAEHGFRPGIVAGHSLGEYSALVASGALSLASATKWVRERGAAMQRAVPSGQGAMAAVMGLSDELVEKLCEQATALAKEHRPQHPEYTVPPMVQPANFNAPAQVVIAGSADGIQEALTLLKAGGDFAGGKAIPLNVSAPFHSKLMAPARDRMARVFADSGSNEMPRTPVCPYIPNRTGRITAEPGLVFELLVEQVDHPVLWRQSMVTLMDSGLTSGIEFGPGKVLQGLAKRISQQHGKPLSVTVVGDTSTLKSAAESLKRSTS